MSSHRPGGRSTITWNTLQIDASKSDFNQIVPAGHCGDSWSCRALVNADTNNWAPRVGFAWQAAGRTVIRGGAGVFYAGQGSLGANSRQINNSPFNRSVVLQSTATRASFLLRQGVPADVLGTATSPPRNSN